MKKRFDPVYARACREQCRPKACDNKDNSWVVAGCWVEDGTAASVTSNAGGSPRCLACGDIIRQRKYLSSEGLRTPGSSPAASPAGSGRATPAE